MKRGRRCRNAEPASQLAGGQPVRALGDEQLQNPEPALLSQGSKDARCAVYFYDSRITDTGTSVESIPLWRRSHIEGWLKSRGLSAGRNRAPPLAAGAHSIMAPPRAACHRRP
jgi:hypothetical protein